MCTHFKLQVSNPLIKFRKSRGPDAETLLVSYLKLTDFQAVSAYQNVLEAYQIDL